MTSDPNLSVPERAWLDVYAVLTDPALEGLEGAKQKALVTKENA